MRLQARIPRLFASTVEADSARRRAKPLLDGSAGSVPNVWKIAPNTVALIGRPAVWFAIDATTPKIPLGVVSIPALHVVWEQDFGGHLFIAIADGDDTRVRLIEAGPANADGSGALVPFCYPEDDFAKRNLIDFEPIEIPPPHGLSHEQFVRLLLDAQRAYDGDQYYLAVELPFLRVGRDSNSYAVGVLLASGVDPRTIPKPRKSMRFEWSGYPGAEDPVHGENFGAYIGAPTTLGPGVVEVAHHAPDGALRFVAVGGAPGTDVTLPSGATVRLDHVGRIAIAPEDAGPLGLPTRRTDPPEQILHRRHFPSDPNPAGAQITLIVDGRPVPLVPGDEHRGTIVDRNDALGLATLHTKHGIEIHLPLYELGVELRDPKRVDNLVRVGNELTVGLHHDRRPRLIAHGPTAFDDNVSWHRFHAPPWRNVALTAGITLVVLGAATWLVVGRR